MERKDKKGRKLRVGEYYDEENSRYIYRKMINGKRYSLSEDDLIKLRKKEANLMVKIEKGEQDLDRIKKLTLDQYFDIWCRNSAKSGRKATTYTNYKAYYMAHVKNTELGRKEMSKIKKMDCQKLFSKMIENGSRKSTLNNMKGCLTLIFADAEDNNVITKNPCRNIRFNSANSRKREAIAEDQVKLFMEFLKNDEEFYYFYSLFCIMFNIGARVGEICALTWDCVDLKLSQLTINKSLNRYRKEEYGFTMAISSTKSKNSVRTIQINDVVKSAFEMQRKYQLSMQVPTAKLPVVDDYGRKTGEISNLVFTQKNGNAWNEPSIIKLIHRIVDIQNRLAKEQGGTKLMYFTPHMIRHTYTTMAFEAGADEKEVAFRLGHASETTTRDTYTHLRGKKKQEQEDIINRIRIV